MTHQEWLLARRIDRRLREISSLGWEWQLWESYRAGVCFASCWRFEAWKMTGAMMGGEYRWFSTRKNYWQGFARNIREEPPLVVLGWTKQEAVQRFYDLFCRERKQDDD